MKYKKPITKGTAILLSMTLTSSITTPIYATSDLNTANTTSETATEITPETTSENISTDTSTDTSKEEVVYCIADANGDVSDIEVVNIFNTPNGEDTTNIVDYGNYSDVKMLTTNDEITQEHNKISFSTNADEVYYQGTLNSTEIPWDISIEYYLDDELINPSDLAGKSGNLKIHFTVNKNDNYKGDIYDNYALQASFTLDRGLCDNISAEGGTSANVGNDKQITYTILPGMGIDTTISADVHDFEMKSVNINGIKLNLKINIDDKLQSQIDKLPNSTKKISDGTVKIVDGLAVLGSNTSNLTNDISNVQEGINSIYTGITGMKDVLNSLPNLSTINLSSDNTEINSSLNSLKGLQSNLSSSPSLATTALTATMDLKKLEKTSSNLTTSINDLVTNTESLKTNFSYENFLNNYSDLETLQTENTETINTINNQIEVLNNEIATNTDLSSTEVDELNKQVSELENLANLLNENNNSISSTTNYINDVNTSIDILYSDIVEIQSLQETFNTTTTHLISTFKNTTVTMNNLANTINNLVAVYEEFSDKMSSYSDEIATIVASYNNILDGFETLALESSNIINNTKISELENGVTSLLSGSIDLSNGALNLFNTTSKIYDDTIGKYNSDYEVKSFTSYKNSNVDSVQFVIKTDAIKIPDEVVETTTEDEKTGFFEKLFNLFR